MVYIRNRNHNFSKVGSGTVKNSQFHNTGFTFFLSFSFAVLVLCSVFRHFAMNGGRGRRGGDQFREVELRGGLLQYVTRIVTADQINKYRN
jgi:hypothetical protein